MKDNQKEKAKSLKELKNYDEALKIYKELYEENPNSFDGYNMAYCLNKLKRYKEAVQFSEQLYGSYPDDKWVKRIYTQALFLGKVSRKSSEFSDHDLKKNIKKIIELEEQDEDSPFWSSRAILQGMGHFSTHGQWESVHDLSKLKNWTLFDKNPNKYKGKTWMSDRENWYLKAAKASFKLKKWDECNAVSKRGFEEFPKNIWLKRDYAISLGHIGNPTEAIKLLNDVLKIKKDWFIHMDIADMYILEPNLNQAKGILMNTCLKTMKLPKPEYRWEMYYKLGVLLVETDELEYAKLHFQLAYALRIENDWKIPELLENTMRQYKVETQFEKSASQFIKELSSYWKK